VGVSELLGATSDGEGAGEGFVRVEMSLALLADPFTEQPGLERCAAPLPEGSGLGRGAAALE